MEIPSHWFCLHQEVLVLSPSCSSLAETCCNLYIVSLISAPAPAYLIFCLMRLFALAASYHVYIFTFPAWGLRYMNRGIKTSPCLTCSVMTGWPARILYPNDWLILTSTFSVARNLILQSSSCIPIQWYLTTSSGLCLSGFPIHEKSFLVVHVLISSPWEHKAR